MSSPLNFTGFDQNIETFIEIKNIFLIISVNKRLLTQDIQINSVSLVITF